MKHNDIKPENIMISIVDEKIQIYLIDLDSISFEKERPRCAVTMDYVPCKYF